MKGLSQEEKAKRYDEALRVLHKYDGANIMFSQSLKEEMFPELKEPENEKIIQFLIHEVKETSDEIMSYRGMNKEAVLAWLEKQGKKTESIEGFDTEFERQISHIIASIINKEYEYTEDSVKRVSNALLNYAKHEFEKQGEQNLSDIDNKFIRMREAKPKDISEFLSRLTTVEQEFLWEHIAKIRELDKKEQKLNDNIDPKFKVGDWIVKNDDSSINIDYSCCKITKVENGNYTIESIDGYKGYNTFETFEKDYHLWTIQDAKDGDVLVYDNGCVEIILLFKKWRNEVGKDAYSYAHITSSWHHINTNNWSDCGLSAHPATKEQRNQLEKAMTNAGYTFDFEKKELRKIEQKSSWSEEDEEMYKEVLTDIIYAKNDLKAKGCHGLSKRAMEAFNWFSNRYKSLRPQNNTTDEELAQPQTTWKPSDEQMSALSKAIAFVFDSNSDVKHSLESLYNELKKL